MKLAKTLLAAAATLAALGANANTVTFGDVTIDLSAGMGNTLVLTLTGVESSTGTWANAATLNAFSLNNIGVDTLTVPGWTQMPGELNANGCAGGGSGKFCFQGSAPVSDLMTFTMSYTGMLDLSGTGLSTPHLKLQFLDANGKKAGSLFSADVPAVPEPETYALMLAGLGAVGFIARRRKQA